MDWQSLVVGRHSVVVSSVVAAVAGGKMMSVGDSVADKLSMPPRLHFYSKFEARRLKTLPMMMSQTLCPCQSKSFRGELLVDSLFLLPKFGLILGEKSPAVPSEYSPGCCLMRSNCN